MSPYRMCANFSSQITIQCEDYLSFEEMFSDWWRACTILMGAGACFLILVAVTSAFGMVVPRLFSKIVTVLIAAVQFIGGELLAIWVYNGILVWAWCVCVSVVGDCAVVRIHRIHIRTHTLHYGSMYYTCGAARKKIWSCAIIVICILGLNGAHVVSSVCVVHT